MFNQISERQAHSIRWILTLGWFLLIFSLFYDPISHYLTKPTNSLSPFRLDPEICVSVQGKCLEEVPYAMGAPIFWGMIVPSAIFVLLILGHEFWRRICPLSFISQIPRAMGWERKRKRTGANNKVRYELVKVDKNSWLAKNHLYLQFGLFFMGLCTRILFVNSNRIVLALFLLGTITAALITGFLYGGKTWCQYICPMAPVQKIYAEPRGLLNSTAHDDDKTKISQSMCRTVSTEGKELSACVACQSPCIDIDAERSYWEGLKKPQQQWLYYGYVGITVGYFVYYYLYSGNWNYYLSGAWAHEENQLGNLLKPGFYLFNQPIPIPKIIAVPLTLAIFVLAAYGLGRFLEKRYKAYQIRHHHLAENEFIRHRIFTLCTFLIFNFFFIFAGHNFIQLLPSPLPDAFPIIIAVGSSLWLYRTWQRSQPLYQREGLANRLRKQLKKLNLEVGRFLEGRTLDDLSANEVYVLAKILPDFSQEKRLKAYRETLKEAIREGYVQPSDSLDNFQQLRQELNISNQDHDRILTALGQEEPDLFEPKQQSQENALRLESYRENLLETILRAWQEHPEQTHVVTLLQAFSEQASHQAIEDILDNLTPEDRAIVNKIREEYGITLSDETEALKHTEIEFLWQAIVEHTGLLGHFSTEAEANVRHVFQEIDQDNSGDLSLTELRTYLHSVDPNFSDAHIETILKRADKDGDSRVSYDEFHIAFEFLAAQTGLLDYLNTRTDEQLATTFKQIDTDSSGYISVTELQSYIKAIDPNFTNTQVQAMLDYADRDQDSQISYEEFKEVFQTLLGASDR